MTLTAQRQGPGAHARSRLCVSALCMESGFHTTHADGLHSTRACVGMRTHTYSHVHTCVCPRPNRPRANSHRSRNVCADLEFPLPGSAWGVMGTLLEPGVPPRRRSPAHLALAGAPPELALIAVPPVPALFQWLKQIEGTEAALTQKMLDLEKEKVKAWTSGRAAAGRAPVICSQEGSACIFIRICMRVGCFCSRALLGNYYSFTLLFT